MMMSEGAIVVHRGVPALEWRRLHHRMVPVEMVRHVRWDMRCARMKGVRRTVVHMRRWRRPPKRCIAHPRIERWSPEVRSARSSVHRKELPTSGWRRLLDYAISMRIVVPSPRGIVRGTARLRGLVPGMARRTVLFNC